MFKPTPTNKELLKQLKLLKKSNHSIRFKYRCNECGSMEYTQEADNYKITDIIDCITECGIIPMEEYCSECSMEDDEIECSQIIGIELIE